MEQTGSPTIPLAVIRWAAATAVASVYQTVPWGVVGVLVTVGRGLGGGGVLGVEGVEEGFGFGGTTGVGFTGVDLPAAGTVTDGTGAFFRLTGAWEVFFGDGVTFLGNSS